MQIGRRSFFGWLAGMLGLPLAIKASKPKEDDDPILATAIPDRGGIKKMMPSDESNPRAFRLSSGEYVTHEWVDQDEYGMVWLNGWKVPCREFRLRAKSAEIVCPDERALSKARSVTGSWEMPVGSSYTVAGLTLRTHYCNVTTTRDLDRALKNGGIRLDPVCGIQLKNQLIRAGLAKGFKPEVGPVVQHGVVTGSRMASFIDPTGRNA
jgi:hypothetical protein